LLYLKNVRKLQPSSLLIVICIMPFRWQSLKKVTITEESKYINDFADDRKHAGRCSVVW
jgi:hypothetical protein